MHNSSAGAEQGGGLAKGQRWGVFDGGGAAQSVVSLVKDCEHNCKVLCEEVVFSFTVAKL